MKTVPDPSLPWPIDYDGVLLIAEFESCKLRAYRCPAGVWTCGWGETSGVGATTQWTQSYADQRFCDSLTERAAAVKAACTVEPSPNELGAMVSLVYNIGLGAFLKSTVLRCHNKGDRLSASRAFNLWNQITDPVTKKKKDSAGLTSRRAREQALYLKPSGDAPEPAMPQAVVAETPLTTSPIAATGTVTAGASAIGLLSSASDQVGTVGGTIQKVKTAMVEQIGIPADYFLPSLGVLAGAVVVWWKVKQRRTGWA